MKFRRFLSGLLFGLGCSLVFVGLLALILPLISNSQLQLVLASFSAPSDHLAIDLFNRAMCFALLYSWRVLLLGVIVSALGAWMMIYFTPKRVRKQTVIPQPAPDPAPVQTDSFSAITPSAPNPFAIGSYNDALSTHPQSKAPSPVFHAAPILEKNRIEPPLSPETSSCEYEPYQPKRLAAEKQAIETETGTPSQSGSRILRRSAYERPIEEPVQPRESVDTDSATEEKNAAAPSPVMTASPTIQPPSSRIRSTMGRHSAAKRNLPVSRS